MGAGRVRLNVRRLMYQTLICGTVAGDDPRRLGAPRDTEDLERLADALVDGVRGDSKLAGDFLRREVLVDEEQAIELALAQPGDSFLKNSRSRIES